MSFRIIKEYEIPKATHTEKTLMRSVDNHIIFPSIPEREEKTSHTPRQEEPPSYNKTKGYASNAVGYRNVSSGFASFSQGKESKARLRTQIAHAGGSFLATGDVQHTRTVLKARNSNSAITRFKLDDVEEYIVHGSRTSTLLLVNIFGASDDPARKCYYGKIRCLVKTSRDAPYLVLDNITKKILFGPPEWKVDVSAESPGSIIFTAEIAEKDINTDVRWIATVESLEHHHEITDLVD